MGKLIELEVEMIDRLEDRAFIEWMIENLDRNKLSLLLFAVDIKLADTAINKLHKGFIRNKLLLKPARRRLRQMKIFPPFPFIFEMKKDELTKEELVENAKENDCDNSQIALILFLQNYYEDALELYDNREKVESKTNAKDAEHEKVQVQQKQSPNESEQEQLPPKIEKRLQQKIKTLTKEKEALIKQMKTLKNELKERNRAHQNEINDLKQEFAEESMLKNSLIKENKNLQIELEKEKKKKKRLSANILKIKQQVVEEKPKIALIGDPMNSSILLTDQFQVDVYELERIPNFVESWTSYNHIFYLSYTLDEISYEERISEGIRKKIIHVENFMKLKKVMGELSYE